MYKRCLLFLLVLFSACSAGGRSATDPRVTLAPQPAPAAFGYRELRDLIQNNHVTTVEQLLPLLPVDYRKRYTLIYKSRGMHGANVFFDQPRVLLYGPDARFMMAFNKNPALPPVVDDRDAVQTMEFDPDTRGFVLRELDFSPGAGPLDPEPQPNPATCLSCHGSDPRPLFDAYNFWPGFYGSVGRGFCDTMQISTPELAGWRAFQANHRHDGRYQYLPPDVPAGDNCGNHDGVAATNGVSRSPNDDLTDLLFDLNAQRIYRRLEALPSHASYVPLLTALGGFCFGLTGLGGTDLPENAMGPALEQFFPPGFAAAHGFASFDDTRNQLNMLARADFDSRLARFNAFNRAANDGERVPVYFEEVESSLDEAVLLKVLADRMGLDMTGLSPNFNDGTFEFASGGREIISLWFPLRDQTVGFPTPAATCQALRASSARAFQ
jgi:hypothetical protein